MAEYYSFPGGSKSEEEQVYLGVDNSALDCLLSVDTDSKILSSFIYSNIDSFYEKQRQGDIVCVIDTPKDRSSERPSKEKSPHERLPKEQGGNKIKTNI